MRGRFDDRGNFIPTPFKARVVSRVIAGRPARFARYVSLLDGWHGCRSDVAIKHLQRKDERMIDLLLRRVGKGATA